MGRLENQMERAMLICGMYRGWNYALNWLIIMPLEITAATITLSFWNGVSEINAAAFVGIFYLVVVSANLIGVKA
jgi:yeast amino acid transporter